MPVFMIVPEGGSVAERRRVDVDLKRLKQRAIISLRIFRNDVREARAVLQLAEPRSMADGMVASLWLGPDHWLLVSDTTSAERILRHCGNELSDSVYNAVDQSAAFTVFRLDGPGVRSLLGAGCGVDLRPESFAAGAVCRTRLAMIAAIIVAIGSEALEVYVDRSLGAYLQNWLEDANQTLALVAEPESAENCA